jgi:hypothetical protein
MKTSVMVDIPGWDLKQAYPECNPNILTHGLSALLSFRDNQSGNIYTSVRLIKIGTGKLFIGNV